MQRQMRRLLDPIRNERPPPPLPNLTGRFGHRSDPCCLFDANDDRIMEAPGSGTRARVRVWINHAREPDPITIALG
jgi:hypothetical protein